MQKEVAAAGWPVEVRILGVNQAGQEGDNALMCDGRDLPWLQEGVDVSIWGAWDVAYRDVIILDEQNRELARYNLTTHDLGNPAFYAELESMLEGFAGAR